MTAMTPQQFMAKWRGVTLKERAAAQEHFIDLCRLVQHPTPVEADPDGSFFTFERGVEKTGGGHGFADVWYRGHFAWEYKTRHRNLNEAYKQLLLYRDNLENPPLLVVCDFEHFEVRTNFTNTPTEVYRFTNEDLAEPRTLHVLRALFRAPEALKPSKTIAEVTEEAAADFARLAPMLTARGIEPHRAAHFLIRVLFCLFAEDIEPGLLPDHLFTRVVVNSVSQPETFEARVRGLFAAMAIGGMYGADNLPYFNGGLFNNARFGPTDVIALTPEELAILHKATKRDWANIEPAIFGTLFERSLDPAKRHQLGAHYTGKDDILRIVEPVVMAPLRERWKAVRKEADELCQQRDEVLARYAGVRGEGTVTQARNRARAAVDNHLARFLSEELGKVTILDPACGSGNFLYVALAQLLELQNEVRTYAADNRVTLPLPTVSPQQLHGYELNAYAAELAQVVIWIGYLQWMLRHYGSFDDRPILKAMDTVQERDAVLDRVDTSRPPQEPEWPSAWAIIGNPPYIGIRRMRRDLGHEYVESLFRVYEGRVSHEADYVCYWFEKARAMVASGKAERVGLLATNSIRGGANREVLQHVKRTGDIFMAWSDEPWTLDGAAVRISLVGFDRGTQQTRTLDGKEVPHINPDLTTGPDVTRAKRLLENQNISFQGINKGGAFDITPEVAARMLAAPLNPNGRPNSDVVRPWVNGSDITGRPRGMHIIDFGVYMPIEQAALYEMPFTYLEQHVLPVRMKNRRAHRRERWWLFAEAAPNVRAGIAPLTRYIATSSVSKYRLFTWVDSRVIPDHALIVIARDDDCTFGVLQSRLHDVWAQRTGTSLGVGNDPRYTPRTTFETFPFPRPTDSQRTAIADAARELDACRKRWLNPPDADESELRRRTLTNLYNENPAWLRHAHRRLDEAVFAAYGWSPSLERDDILEGLLSLNLERAKLTGEAVPVPVGDSGDSEEEEAV
jgi:type II restriction/modification system DNA methylase subunit YeeA